MHLAQSITLCLPEQTSNAETLLLEEDAPDRPTSIIDLPAGDTYRGQSGEATEMPVPELESLAIDLGLPDQIITCKKLVHTSDLPGESSDVESEQPSSRVVIDLPEYAPGDEHAIRTAHTDQKPM